MTLTPCQLPYHDRKGGRGGGIEKQGIFTACHYDLLNFYAQVTIYEKKKKKKFIHIALGAPRLEDRTTHDLLPDVN